MTMASDECARPVQPIAAAMPSATAQSSPTREVIAPLDAVRPAGSALRVASVDPAPAHAAARSPDAARSPAETARAGAAPTVRRRSDWVVRLVEARLVQGT